MRGRQSVAKRTAPANRGQATLTRNGQSEDLERLPIMYVIRRVSFGKPATRTARVVRPDRNESFVSAKWSGDQRSFLRPDIIKHATIVNRGRQPLPIRRQARRLHIYICRTDRGKLVSLPIHPHQLRPADITLVGDGAPIRNGEIGCAGWKEVI